ncbi:Y-family DNA polymerase [Rubricoccus marinus]|uniref:Y-family DNA polymerase n=1 Tax=Rubricoccus marinus TaxID=716817 RepID=UPI001C533A46|nr:Y-family DNA polymerase [Rubricoccus marinus]
MLPAPPEASPSRLFALVDASNFYVSCERVFRADLRQRPVVVLSNNDGCIVSRSQEVKRAGIPNGAPYFKTKRQLERMGAAVFSSNYELYGDFSRRVMEVLGTFTPDVEPYSIDEAFLVLHTPTPEDRDPARLRALAKTIRDRVLAWTKIPVRVSIAPTKTLCKAASELARLRGGAVSLHGLSPEAMSRALELVPVQDVWGVGRATARKLDARGVKTARQLRDLSDAWVRKHLHTVGMRTVYELRGVSCIPLERAPRPRRTLMRSRSFGTPVTEPLALREALSTHASAACATLREEGLAAKAVQIFYHTGRHGPGPHRSASLALPLATPTSCTDAILSAVHALLAQSWASGDARGTPFRYKKAGVMLLDLAPSAEAQADLFSPRSPERQRLFETMDALNRRYAQPAMSPAVFLAATHLRRPGAARAWETQRNHTSPRYTTVRADLPTVRV